MSQRNPNAVFFGGGNGANAASPQLLAVWRGWLAPGGTVPLFDVHLSHDGGTTRAIVAEYLSQGTTHAIALDVTNCRRSARRSTRGCRPTGAHSRLLSSPGGGNVHSTWMDDANGYLYVSIGDVATNVYDMRGFAYYNANSVLSLAQSPPVVIQAGSNPPQVLHYPMAVAPHGPAGHRLHRLRVVVAGRPERWTTCARTARIPPRCWRRSTPATDDRGALRRPDVELPVPGRLLDVSAAGLGYRRCRRRVERALPRALQRRSSEPLRDRHAGEHRRRVAGAAHHVRPGAAACAPAGRAGPPTSAPRSPTSHPGGSCCSWSRPTAPRRACLTPRSRAPARTGSVVLRRVGVRDRRSFGLLHDPGAAGPAGAVPPLRAGVSLLQQASLTCEASSRGTWFGLASVR